MNEKDYSKLGVFEVIHEFRKQYPEFPDLDINVPSMREILVNKLQIVRLKKGSKRRFIFRKPKVQS